MSNVSRVVRSFGTSVLLGGLQLPFDSVPLAPFALRRVLPHGSRGYLQWERHEDSWPGTF